MAKIVAVVLFIVLGSFALIASLFNLKWFFTSENGRLFIKLFGYKGARIFYGIVGALILYMAYEIIKTL